MKVKLIPFIIASLFLTLFLPLILADFNFQNPDLPKLEHIPEVITFNNNTAFVNATNIWITNIGALYDANSTQFEENDDNLNIKESWLITFGDTIWCALTGCTMTGDINMNNNNINNVENLTVLDRIFLGDQDHFFKKGAEGFNGLSENAFSFQHVEEHEGGSITFIVTANKTGSDDDVVNIMTQSGRNNSAGVLGNSWMVIPNNLTTNLTILSNCFLVAEELGETLRVACDTSDTGADLVVHDDIQAFGTVFADEGIRAEELASFIMKGNDFQIQNGSLHIFTPVDFTSGVTAGNPVTTFNEFFLGGLGSFTNLQVDAGNWFTTSDVLCDDGDCANAIGISGSGNVIMEVNISTTNINSTSLNFVYSLVNILGLDSFTVTANNNVGSGEVTLLTDSTANVILESTSIGMPSSMWDQPKVSLRFECDATQSNRECYVDTISVNGTAIDTTLTNQSGFDSQICFGSGVKDAGGVCGVGVFYNATSNTVFTKGNWNVSGAGGGVTEHSALTNLEWNVAGHTFSSEEQVMDIENYNFTTNGTATFRDIKAVDWSNVTALTDTLYAGIEWDYNQTIDTFNLWNFTWDYNHTSASFNNWGEFWYNQSLASFNNFGEFWYNQSLDDFNNFGDTWINHTQETFDTYNSTWDNTGQVNMDFTNIAMQNETNTFEEDQIFNEYINFSGGGYIRDNGTATIIGHS